MAYPGTGRTGDLSESDSRSTTKERHAMQGSALARRMLIKCIHDAVGGNIDEFFSMSTVELISWHQELRRMGHAD